MKPRIKMHQMPGDISKREKIAMLEGRSTIRTRKCSKSYKKKLRMKERAVLKERNREMVSNSLGY
jgi:hypothetical protein